LLGPADRLLHHADFQLWVRGLWLAGRPAPRGNLRPARHARDEVALVARARPRVAQHFVGFAEPDEDGLERVPQVGEGPVVLDVGMEAFGEAEVGLFDLRLA